MGPARLADAVRALGLLAWLFHRPTEPTIEWAEKKFKNKPEVAAANVVLNVTLVAVLPGLGMGIAAVVLGIKGLRNVRVNPEAKGTVHAWIAIVCGLLL